MAKRVCQPVKVVPRPREGGGTEPALFVWQDRRYLVLTVEAIWKEVGRWWDGDEERTTYRVAAVPEGTASAGPFEPGTYELCLRQKTGQWTLVEIQD
jgi:uncharacterized protein DUF6504